MDVFTALNALNRYAEHVSRSPVTVQAGVCVLARHRDASCDRCVTACPTDALSFTDSGVALADDQCVQCGACAHICPTGAIHTREDGHNLVQRVVQHGAPQHVEVACPYHPQLDAQADPEARLFIAPRCLIGLSTWAYTELANAGVRHVTLRTDACAACPIGAAVEQIRATAAQGNALLATPPTLTITTIAEVPTGASPPVIVDSTKAAMSRRGLFQMFTGDVRSEAPPPPTLELPATLPPERKRLLNALAQRPGDVPAWAPTLTVEGPCTACEVCANICPTDALTVPKERNTFRLDLHTQHCTACDLCTVACPEGVLHLGTVNQPAHPKHDPVTLFTGLLQTCKRCKTRFSGDGDLCPACAFRRKNPFGSYIAQSTRMER